MQFGIHHFSKRNLFLSILFISLIGIMFSFAPKASAAISPEKESILEIDDEVTQLAPTYDWWWEASPKSFEGQTYSPYKTCVSADAVGITLTCTHSESVNNTYSGSMKVSRNDIDRTLGYSITESKTLTVGGSKKSTYIGEPLEYRQVFDNYKVIQKQYRRNINTGETVVISTEVIYSKKFSHFSFR